MKFLAAFGIAALLGACSKEAAKSVPAAAPTQPLPAPFVAISPEPIPTYSPSPRPTPAPNPPPEQDQSLASIAGTYDAVQNGQPLNGGTLTINPDGNWSVFASDESGGHSATGRATMSGDRLTLLPSIVDGRPPTGSDADPIVLIVSPDGRTLRQDQSGLSFVRRG